MNELSLITAVASVLIAGVFFTFSSFVMKALGNIKTSEGIRAMQRINIDVFSWSFASLFFGIPIASVILGIYAVVNWADPYSIYFLMGSLIYLLGSLLVTGIRNVPLNNMLARVDPDSTNAIDAWQKYLISWVHWNHVRAGASLIAGVVFGSISIV